MDSAQLDVIAEIVGKNGVHQLSNITLADVTQTSHSVILEPSLERLTRAAFSIADGAQPPSKTLRDPQLPRQHLKLTILQYAGMREFLGGESGLQL